MILSFYKLFRKEISIYLLLKLLRKGMTSPGVKKKKNLYCVDVVEHIHGVCWGSMFIHSLV